MGRFITGCVMLVIIFPICAIVAFALRRSAKADRSRGGLNNYAQDKEFGAVVAKWAGRAFIGFGVAFIGWSTIRVVPANHVGIPTEFGNIKAPLDSGIHFVSPWTDVNLFSTRMQESSMLGAADEGDKAKDDSIEVRGSDGYKMNVDVTVRYFINQENASALFKLVGSEDGIRERLVRPEVREAVRLAFAGFTSEEGYTSQREAIRDAAQADLEKRLARYGLRLDSVAIRNVAPDAALGQAISDRAAARERALQAEIEQGRLVTEAETRRQVAEKDAEAKLIAANAEAQANDIVAASLTDAVLEAKRIEALRDANTVYVPYDSTVLVGGTVTK